MLASPTQHSIFNCIDIQKDTHRSKQSYSPNPLLISDKIPSYDPFPSSWYPSARICIVISRYEKPASRCQPIQRTQTAPPLNGL